MRITVLVSIILASAGAFANTLDKGLHALIAGDLPKAEAELSAAVREQPNNAVARFNYASALRELGRGPEAVAEYQAAICLASDPTVRGDALYGIALTRDSQADPVAAEQAWREYLKFAQGRPTDDAAAQIARQNLARAQREASIPRVVQ